MHSSLDFLTPEKLELIFKYLQDQRKLVKIPTHNEYFSRKELPLKSTATPTEPSISPAFPSKLAFKASGEANDLYNMFAIPLPLSHKSTELNSASQNLQDKYNSPSFESLAKSEKKPSCFYLHPSSPNYNSLCQPKNLVAYLQAFRLLQQRSGAYCIQVLNTGNNPEKKIHKKKRPFLKIHSRDGQSGSNLPLKSPDFREEKLPRINTGH